ncbi:MAG TPA: DNA-binding protein WhiA [Euzebya sp.]|nr:DNA-binding protein WhiA [Euzebya sp.]
MSLTVRMREELAHRPPGAPDARLAEASAMVRFGGTLRLRGGGGGIAVEVRCAQGAVARRLRATLVEVLGTHPGLARRQGGNLSGSAAYLVDIEQAALGPLGILDSAGRPVRGIGPGQAAHRNAYLAGVLMVAGTLSGVGQPVHLEVTAPGQRSAADVGALLGVTATGTRLVLKHGEVVADLLAAVGATATFLAFDQGRMRRDLRRQVNRSVNADRANLRRTAEAASATIQAIQQLLDTMGWDGLPDDLRDVALVRVANPEASLLDLGQLLDPPIGKTTVHRRLKRLEAMASDPTAEDRPRDQVD